MRWLSYNVWNIQSGKNDGDEDGWQQEQERTESL